MKSNENETTPLDRPAAVPPSWQKEIDVRRAEFERSEREQKLLEYQRQERIGRRNNRRGR